MVKHSGGSGYVKAEQVVSKGNIVKAEKNAVQVVRNGCGDKKGGLQMVKQQKAEPAQNGAVLVMSAGKGCQGSRMWFHELS